MAKEKRGALRVRGSRVVSGKPELLSGFGEFLRLEGLPPLLAGKNKTPL